MQSGGADSLRHASSGTEIARCPPPRLNKRCKHLHARVHHPMEGRDDKGVVLNAPRRRSVRNRARSHLICTVRRSVLTVARCGTGLLDQASRQRPSGPLQRWAVEVVLAPLSTSRLIFVKVSQIRRLAGSL